ncbi:hypothetical protein BJ508DRAFT_343334, partial [Ascobolus immersus RN42]
ISQRQNKTQKTYIYSTKDFCGVTHRSTNLAIRSLTMGERTGSRIFFNLWPYVTKIFSLVFLSSIQYNLSSCTPCLRKDDFDDSGMNTGSIRTVLVPVASIR